MSLNQYQRQVLVNQHKILALLSTDDSDKSYHEMMREIYNSGYEYDYFEYGPYKDDQVLLEEDCKFVYEVINMYDDLYYYWKTNEEAKENIKEYDVMFSGFDLNDEHEGKLYSYANFLIKDLDKFHDTNDLLKEGKIRELNSHGAGPGISGYQQMLGKFKEYNSQRLHRDNHDFTADELKDIIEYYK